MPSDRDRCACGHKRENHGGITPKCREPGCNCPTFRQILRVVEPACCLCGGTEGEVIIGLDERVRHACSDDCIRGLYKRARQEDENLGGCISELREKVGDLTRAFGPQTESTPLSARLRALETELRLSREKAEDRLRGLSKLVLDQGVALSALQLWRARVEHELQALGDRTTISRRVDELAGQLVELNARADGAREDRKGLGAAIDSMRAELEEHRHLPPQGPSQIGFKIEPAEPDEEFDPEPVVPLCSPACGDSGHAPGCPREGKPMLRPCGCATDD